MKALYISYDGVLEPLGHSQIIPYLVGLAQKGIRFYLLSFDKQKQLQRKQGIVETKRMLSQNNIEWKSLCYHKRFTLLATSFDVLQGLIRGVFIIRKNKIHVIHARSYVPALVALILSKLLRMKFIFDMRGLWADERVDGNIWSRDSLLYKIAKWWEKILILNASRITVLTHKVKEEIENFDYLNGRSVDIEVIPTCTDLNLFQIQQKKQELLEELRLKDKFVFIYIGSVGTWYMLEEMIDFFKSAKKKITNSHFLFLTPYVDVVSQCMQKKRISQALFSVKTMAYKEIPQYLSIADISIFFIKPSYSKKGSCPTKFGESLACGLPVLVNSGIGDIDRIIKNEKVGVLIDNFSERDYLGATEDILSLLSEGDIRNRCRNVAREYFSLDKALERYWQIYKGL